MTTLNPSQTIAELDTIEMQFPRLGETVQNVTDFELRDHFLESTRSWYVRVGSERITDALAKKLNPGEPVQFLVNGQLYLSGYLDRMTVRSGRSGTELTMQGRDALAPIQDACADHHIHLKDGASIEDALNAHIIGPNKDKPFFPFDEFLFSDETNVSLLGGRTGYRLTKGSKKKGPQISKKSLRQTQPYDGQGLFEYLDGLLKRQGLFMWCSADGTKLVVGRPNVIQAPTYRLVHDVDGAKNNILSAELTKDFTHQPAVIFVGANSYRGGITDYDRSNIKVAMINPAGGFGTDQFATERVADWLQAQKDAVPLTVAFTKGEADTFRPSGIARPLYKFDQEAQTLEQLEFYGRRLLCEHIRRHFVYTTTVAGWSSALIGDTSGSGKTLWSTDTIVEVRDVRCGVDEPLYVLSTTYSKSRSGGTTTRLELVRPSSMQWTQASIAETKDVKKKTAVKKSADGTLYIGSAKITVDPKTQSIKAVNIVKELTGDTFTDQGNGFLRLVKEKLKG